MELTAGTDRVGLSNISSETDLFAGSLFPAWGRFSPVLLPRFVFCVSLGFLKQ